MSYRMTALVTIVVVLAMELLFWKYLNAFLFYVLYPGNAVMLMITGGHGTTGAQDALAKLLGILINVVAYVVVVTIVRKTMAGASRASK